MLRELVTACDPRPKTLALDLSRQSRVSTTILNGLHDLDADLDTDGVRVLFAGLPDSALATARHWAWWQDVERSGRALPSVDAAISSLT